jgi:D-serine deaminase-like pyridoxal phosphate-dependent protein
MGGAAMGIEHGYDRIGCPVADIDTPCLLVDFDALERNIRRMAEFGTTNGIGIRPHAKAHKTPIIAHMQLAAGAVGICCQKVGEAEAMVAGGVRDILISNEVVGSAKLRRLTALARLAHIAVAVDARAAAEALSTAATATSTTVGVVVDVDVGQGRCGVAPGQPAVDLGAAALTMPGLSLRGLQGYQGALQHVPGHEARAQAAHEANARLMETRALFEKNGFPLEIVTGGGTGTYDTEGLIPGMTDIQPGSYIFMDRQYREIGGLGSPTYDDFEPSLSVLATVMSTPTPDRLVLDAGLKALSNDAGPAAPVDLPGWEYKPAGDEHGLLVRCGDGPRPSLGDTVRMLPSHCDTTVNLYDQFHVVRAGSLEAIWSIPGRGKTR